MHAMNEHSLLQLFEELNGLEIQNLPRSFKVFRCTVLFHYVYYIIPDILRNASIIGSIVIVIVVVAIIVITLVAIIIVVVMSIVIIIVVGILLAFGCLSIV